jgi:hypothetical protein
MDEATPKLGNEVNNHCLQIEKSFIAVLTRSCSNQNKSHQNEPAGDDAPKVARRWKFGGSSNVESEVEAKRDSVERQRATGPSR